MKILGICPTCGSPALEVETITVKSFVNTFDVEENLQWHLCTAKKCDTAYFSDSIVITTAHLIKPIWFKTDDDNVPVCYCSDLRRGEIYKSVNSGSKTIDDVQKQTGKNSSGKCQTMNPTGLCCREAFLYAIREAGRNPDNTAQSECCCSH